MTLAPIHLSREDYTKLRLLLASIAPGSASRSQHKLREELDRALVVESPALPSDVVALDSTVEYEDLATGEIETYTLTLPERARIEERRLSILAPIGTALLGYRVGDVVNWSTPGGERQLRIRRATPAVGRS